MENLLEVLDTKGFVYLISCFPHKVPLELVALSQVKILFHVVLTKM